MGSYKGLLFYIYNFFKEMGTDSEMGRKGAGSLRKANDLQKRREAIEKQEANLERIQVNFIFVKWNNNFSLLVTNKVSEFIAVVKSEDSQTHKQNSNIINLSKK